MSTCNKLLHHYMEDDMRGKKAKALRAAWKAFRPWVDYDDKEGFYPHIRLDRDTGEISINSVPGLIKRTLSPGCGRYHYQQRKRA